jgi:hypothetical protein
MSALDEIHALPLIAGPAALPSQSIPAVAHYVTASSIAVMSLPLSCDRALRIRDATTVSYLAE